MVLTTQMKFALFAVIAIVIFIIQYIRIGQTIDQARAIKNNRHFKRQVKSKPGLAYSPYNDNGSCKTRTQVFADINLLSDFRLIRSYGISCNQVRNIIDAARPHGIKVFLGVYGVHDSASELTSLINSVNREWGIVDTIAIGNEHVYMGLISAAALATKVNESRTIFRAAGFGGPVVAVDTVSAIANNPILCQSSDYVAVNVHPWFDTNTPAANSGSFLTAQFGILNNACEGKRIVVTETGWPYRGDTHGQAIASRANQEAAVSAIYSVTGDSGIFLGPFDDAWKIDGSGTYNAEKFGGLLTSICFNLFSYVLLIRLFPF